MADSERGRDARLTVDLPGLTSEPVTATVTDPNGMTVVEDTAATSLGSGRYQVLLAGALAPSVAGIWEAVYTPPSGLEVRQQFSVGPRTPGALSKYDLRIQVHNRIVPAIHGTVTSSAQAQIADLGLRGGSGNFVGWWIMLDPDGTNDGLARRVTAFAGNALELEAPFIASPQPGAQYTLFRYDPEEMDRAIASAASELAPAQRVEISTSDVSVIDSIARIPNGYTHIHAVWSIGTDVDEIAILGGTTWRMLPGRRIAVPDSSETIELVGIRSATFPRWEASSMEIDSQVLVARSALILHAGRASGSGVDMDEHLRRQLASQDEFERSLARSLGRLPHGSRAVIE